MEKSFRLHIYTLSRDHYINSVKLITVPTSDGMVGILPHHITYFAETVDGSVLIISDKDFEFVRTINSGFLSFENNICKIWSF